MKPSIYRVTDAVGGLIVGHLYEAYEHGARFFQLAEVNTRHTTTLYRHEVEQAVLSGRLKLVDMTQSEAMQAPIVGRLCHSTTTTHYIY